MNHNTPKLTEEDRLQAARFAAGATPAPTVRAMLPVAEVLAAHSIALSTFYVLQGRPDTPKLPVFRVGKANFVLPEDVAIWARALRDAAMQGETEGLSSGVAA